MSADPTNAIIVENMNRTIGEASNMVALAGRQIEWFANGAEEFAPLATYTNTLFFIAQVDLDTRVLLRNLVSDPSARITSEKYLAFALIEAERGSGIIFNKLRRSKQAAREVSGLHRHSHPSVCQGYVRRETSPDA